MSRMIEKDSVELTTRTAAMSVDQRIARIFEIADSHDTSDEAALEAVKLLSGPDAIRADSIWQ